MCAAICAGTLGLALVVCACSGADVARRTRPARPSPPPPPAPLAPGEIQQVVDGAARLAAACRKLDSPTGLYQIRLTLQPDGAVSKVEPMRAPSRAEDPSGYSGVARYVDGDRDPETPVIRCFAEALGTLRFRRFGGPEVAFDYPVVVENLPPSEATGAERACASDEECVFRSPVRCACPPCGRTWRRAINRLVAQKLQRRQRRRPRRRCPRRRCPTCQEPAAALLGGRALCIDGQCSVR